MLRAAGWHQRRNCARRPPRCAWWPSFLFPSPSAPGAQPWGQGSRHGRCSGARQDLLHPLALRRGPWLRAQAVVRPGLPRGQTRPPPPPCRPGPHVPLHAVPRRVPRQSLGAARYPRRARRPPALRWAGTVSIGRHWHHTWRRRWPSACGGPAPPWHGLAGGACRRGCVGPPACPPWWARRRVPRACARDGSPMRRSACSTQWGGRNRPLQGGGPSPHSRPRGQPGRCPSTSGADDTAGWRPP